MASNTRTTKAQLIEQLTSKNVELELLKAAHEAHERAVKISAKYRRPVRVTELDAVELYSPKLHKWGTEREAARLLKAARK